MILHLIILSAMMSIVAGDAAAQVVSRGTAFSVAPELLITNQHVVKGCSSVDVISPDGRRTGSIATADADIDLAILHVSELKGTTARLRDPTNVFLGEPVLVFGYPGGCRVAETSPQVSLALCGDSAIRRTSYRSLRRYSRAIAAVH